MNCTAGTSSNSAQTTINLFATNATPPASTQLSNPPHLRHPWRRSRNELDANIRNNRGRTQTPSTKRNKSTQGNQYEARPSRARNSTLIEVDSPQSIRSQLHTTEAQPHPDAHDSYSIVHRQMVIYREEVEQLSSQITDMRKEFYASLVKIGERISVASEGIVKLMKDDRIVKSSLNGDTFVADRAHISIIIYHISLSSTTIVQDFVK